MNTPSKFSAMLGAKCPGCRQSDLFPKGPYNLKYINKMREVCPVCGVSYEKETGFYYIAMYLTFAFNVAFFAITFFILQNFFNELSIPEKIAIVLTVLLLIAPLNFRYSRVICIYFFSGVKFKG